MDSLNALLTRLFTLHRKTIELSLGRIERLLAALGSPEARLPPIVHVAGTNGKGSTIAFMRAILEAAGKRVHVYTSPHLVRFHERIRLGAEGGGKLVGDAELFAALTACEKANEGQPITFFEVTTAAAEPLDEPAGECAVFHGLRAGGKGRVKSGPPIANSCVSCLPSRIAPAARNRTQVSASSPGTCVS